LDIFIPIIDGLNALHRLDLLHLDIKPDNIFLRDNSTPCLIDFGGVRQAYKTSRRLSSYLVETEDYSPPEQSEDEEQDFSTDLYAMGMSLYYALTLDALPSSGRRSRAVIKTGKYLLIPLGLRLADQYSDHFLQAVDKVTVLNNEHCQQTGRALQDDLRGINVAIEPRRSPPF